jgi:perosamine synthetase
MLDYKRVPLIHIGRTVPPAAAPIRLRDILSGSSALRHGRRELGRFKAELKDYFAVKHCFLVSSGKAALALILNALKDLYPNKDQVIIPAYTCYSVPSVIVRAGLNIQLCDMDPETLDFDYTQVCKLIHPLSTEPNKFKQLNELNKPNNSLLSIIPAHLFGIPANIDRVRSLLGDKEVVIVEDAAQAMGGKCKNRKLGTLGDVSFFSLGRGKALSTVEGGIILTNRDDIAQKISELLTHIPGYNVLELFNLVIEAILLSLFMHPSLFWLPKSLPFLSLGATIYNPGFKIRRMSPFQAGMAKNWKTKIEGFQKARKVRSKVWSTFIHNLKTYELSVISHPPGSDLIRFPVRVKNFSLRKAILNRSDRKGLGIMPGYPDSIDGIPALRTLFSEQNFPIAKQYSQQLITLPVHPYVSERDRAKASDLIIESAQRIQAIEEGTTTYP